MVVTVMIFTTETTENSEKVHISSASALRTSQSATGCFTATCCRTVMIFTTETTENTEKVHVSSASALRPSQSATGCFTATCCCTVMIFTTENSEKVHNFVRVCVTYFLIGYRLLYRYTLPDCNDLYHRDHRELGESSCLSGSALHTS